MPTEEAEDAPAIFMRAAEVRLRRTVSECYKLRGHCADIAQVMQTQVVQAPKCALRAGGLSLVFRVWVTFRLFLYIYALCAPMAVLVVSYRRCQAWDSFVTPCHRSSLGCLRAKRVVFWRPEHGGWETRCETGWLDADMKRLDLWYKGHMGRLGMVNKSELSSDLPVHIVHFALSLHAKVSL